MIPPLIVSEEECDKAFAIIKEILLHTVSSQKEAQKLVKYNDGMLKSRYEYMTNSDMRDCRTRHMMIDSSILGLEKQQNISCS